MKHLQILIVFLLIPVVIPDVPVDERRLVCVEFVTVGMEGIEVCSRHEWQLTVNPNRKTTNTEEDSDDS